MDDFVGLLLALGLVLLNAFFVAAEYALVSVRRSRIETLIATGNVTAKVVRAAISDLDRYIAAIQLCITMAGLGLGWVGEPALGHIVQPGIEALLRPVVHLLPPGVVEASTVVAIGSGITFLIITFVLVVLGELMPKAATLQNPEAVALFVVRPIVWTGRLLHWPIRLLNGTANTLLRLIGVDSDRQHELVHSVDELRILIRSSAESGLFAQGEDDIMEAVFEMGETRARRLMVPRTEITAFQADLPLDAVIDQVAESNLTKFPIYEEDLDRVVGILHTKDLLRAMRRPAAEGAVLLRDLVRPALFVSEAITINDLLARFRADKQHLALLLDEYGGTAGLIALEDLVEELVGDVQDAFEGEEVEVEEQADGTVIFSGLTPIDEVNEHLGLALDDPKYETIAGYILGRLDRLAQPGDRVETERVILTVEQLDGLRIDRVRVEFRPDGKGHAAAPAGAQAADEGQPDTPAGQA